MRKSTTASGEGAPVMTLTDLPEEESLLSAARMKQFVDLSVSELRNRARDHQIPCVRFGKRYLFPKRTLLRFLQQRAMASLRGREGG